MKWKKLGRIFDPEICGRPGYTHGANPFPVQIADDLIRIYYNCRDINNRSNITYLDYNMNDRNIVYIHDEFLLTPGQPGLFDDSGCSLGCVLNMPTGEKYIYYLGWNICTSVPWMNYIGLAILDTSGHCKKYGNVPILERSPVDYLSCSYPYVMFDKGKYRMWYGSNLAWGPKESDMRHVIKYAESTDGIHWTRDGTVCIQGKNHAEYAFSKPSVWKEGNLYKMCYSFRGQAYRIGYAESPDGLIWKRLDEQAGITVSGQGWDCEMLDYPAVFDYKGEKYMVYCGNSYGKTGFGLAVMTEP